MSFKLPPRDVRSESAGPLRPPAAPPFVSRSVNLARPKWHNLQVPWDGANYGSVPPGRCQRCLHFEQSGSRSGELLSFSRIVWQLYWGERKKKSQIDDDSLFDELLFMLTFCGSLWAVGGTAFFGLSRWSPRAREALMGRRRSGSRRPAGPRPPPRAGLAVNGSSFVAAQVTGNQCSTRRSHIIMDLRP